MGVGKEVGVGETHGEGKDKRVTRASGGMSAGRIGGRGLILWVEKWAEDELAS